MDWRAFSQSANDSLENTLAHRDSSTRMLMQLAQQAQQERAQQERLALDQKRYAADEDIRRDTLANNKAYRDSQAADRERNDNIAAEGRFQNRLKILPKGTIIGKKDRGDFDKFGAAPLLKHHGADAHSAEDHDEFLGTESAAESEAKLAQQQAVADLRNEVATGRLSVAQAQAELARQRLEMDRNKLPKPVATPQTPEEKATEAGMIVTAKEKAKQAAKPESFVSRALGSVFGSHQVTPPAAKIKLQAPTGEVMEVASEDDAKHYEQLGAKRVQ